MSVVALMLMLLPVAALPDRNAALLAGAEERIAQHRTGECELRLVGPDGMPLAPGVQVRIEQTRHAFLFGSNIFMLNRFGDAQENAAYGRHFAELLNFATLPFYWWAYEPQRGQEQDDRTRMILEWCNQNGITAKGHPLAWNYRDPPWLAGEPAETMALQVERIGRIVSRFENDIRYWDVVNEATAFDREETKRNSPKLTSAIAKTGVPEYVRSAYVAARKANPRALLIINDYVTSPDYAEKVIKRLVDAEGKPLYDIIGIQCHQHGGAWSASHTWEICERFAKFGKPLHFTEATILSGEQGWDLAAARQQQGFQWASTPAGEKRQAEQVVRFYTMLFSHPAVEAITWWDFADKGAWQAAPAGFLRNDLTPKPAYHALKELIKDKWWTKTQVRIARGGAAKFRGFFGDYRVTASIDGKELTGVFHFGKKIPGVLGIRLK